MNNIQNKCQLYKLLLNPGSHDQTSDCLEEALRLVTEIVGARLGYIEFFNSLGESCWSANHCNKADVKIIRSRISNTIISEAVSTGQTIVTPSAILDDRFNGANSVVLGKIESVLCSPINCEGFNGIIYLQGELNGLCDRQNIDEAEFFAQSISPLLKRLKYHLSPQEPEDDLRDMYNLEGVIGNSSSLKKVLNEAMTIASFDVSLLMNGETGTGKTHLAKVIHDNSARSDGNFVHINCANLPESLFESELFGAAKGAYSGAVTAVSGKVMAADNGTLFLDEISEMPLSAQAKLLQFLEEGFFFPLGSSKALKPDVRIIVASNRDFSEQISNGTFREDLYYRITNFAIVVPPLRERIDDIEPLVKFFIDVFSDKFNHKGVTLSNECLMRMMTYNWPGNIRELQNKIQQGIIKAKIDRVTEIGSRYIFSDAKKVSQIDPKIGDGSFAAEKNKWEKKFLFEQLVINKWNVTKTAATLQMSRSHLNRLIKDYSLKKPESTL